MFVELANVAEERGCARVDWKVPKSNKGVPEFSAKVIGATPSEEYQSIRLGEKGMESLKLKNYRGGE